MAEELSVASAAVAIQLSLLTALMYIDGCVFLMLLRFCICSNCYLHTKCLIYHPHNVAQPVPHYFSWSMCSHGGGYEATLHLGRTEHGQGITAGRSWFSAQGWCVDREAALRWSMCLKMVDLKHSNHNDASKDPVTVEAQSCHQSQGAEGSLP